MQLHDLAVIGAGPGGAAAALGAARAGLSVCVFDPRPEADKPCGEGILPSGVRALLELDLDEILGAGHPFDCIRYRVPGVAPLVVPLSGTGFSIARPRLAGWLVDALEREQGIELVRARARVERDGRGGFAIRADGRSFAARVLVAADGAHGECARGLRSERAGGTGESAATRSEGDLGARAGERFGLRVRARAAHALDAVEVHLGAPEIYLTPLPDGIVNVAVLFASAPHGVRGGAELLEHALAAHPSAAARLGELVAAPTCRRLGAPRRRVSREGAFAVGDAGGGVDPILGCGVSIALVTGIRAGRAAAALCRGAARSAVEREYARAYRAETDARRRLALFLRAVASNPFAARAVVRLGRALPSLTRALVGIATGARAPEVHAA